jgi:hypothetical protein
LQILDGKMPYVPTADLFKGSNNTANLPQCILS